MGVIPQRKICMLGDFAVGKTSLVCRFVQGRFDDSYLSTIGVKVSRREVEIATRGRVNLLLWDLAGGEDFSGGQAGYLIGAVGALLVCDLTRASTLDTLDQYVQRMRMANPTVRFVVIGNKVDLIDQHELSEEKLSQFASSINAPHYLTSAKTGAHVELAFTTLAGQVFA